MPCALALELVLPLFLQGKVVKLAGDMQFTEGPVWLPEEQVLVFSDIPASKLMRWSPDKGLDVYRESEHSNGNLLDLEGRLLSCQHGARNIVRWETDGSITVLADRYQGKRFNSPNDLALQSDGTLWFTDPPWGLENLSDGKELDGHFVFQRTPEGEVKAVLRECFMPNGIALSPDERHLYVADTGPHPRLHASAPRNASATLTAYEIRAIGEKRELAPEPVWRIETRCDGMCVDEQGRIYTTDREGVRIWKPDGMPAGFIAVPEPPANACFGGDEFQTLFITARTSLYSVEMQVPGYRPEKR